MGDLGLIPGLGISPGEGNGNSLQYSCLEDSMDRGAWQATWQAACPWGCKELDMTEQLILPLPLQDSKVLRTQIHQWYKYMI